MSEPTPMTQAEQIAKLEQEIRSWQITVENRDSEILQLKAELEAVGAGGVQALRSPLKTEKGVAPDKTAVCDFVQTDCFGKPAPQPQVEPAGIDERAAFDDFFRKRNGLHPDTDTTYRSDAAEPWKYWQARAALATTQPEMVGETPKSAEKQDETRMDTGIDGGGQIAPAGEYPALPEPMATMDAWPDDIRRLDVVCRGALPPEGTRLYTGQQMRDFADATHATRTGEQEPMAWPYNEIGKVIQEWERQKRLFPILLKDGWMDAALSELRLANSPTAADSLLLHALKLACDHIDMDSLRISHGKDAAAIDAAISATTPPVATTKDDE